MTISLVQQLGDFAWKRFGGKSFKVFIFDAADPCFCCVGNNQFQFGAQKIFLVRITSYNVCYTKLLRAEKHQLEKEFVDWLHESCTFCNTLVDRIVTGFPKDNIQEIQASLGYEDNLVVTGEYFHLWAIEAPMAIREKFPFDKAGLNAGH